MSESVQMGKASSIKGRHSAVRMAWGTVPVRRRGMSIKLRVIVETRKKGKKKGDVIVKRSWSSKYTLAQHYNLMLDEAKEYVASKVGKDIHSLKVRSFKRVRQ